MARRAAAGSTGPLRSPARRRLLVGGTTTALAAVTTGALARPVRTAAATTAKRAASEVAGYVPRPAPTQYDFTVTEQAMAPDGGPAVTAVTVNGTIPGPEIRVREGETLRILVRDEMPSSPTTIHWHGLLVPAGMDGVPDISNAPIAPRQMYVYEYPIRQTGTYWYHSHYGFQEQQGMYGAFVIEEAHDPVRADRDAVVLLGDWLHRAPTAVFAALRGASDAPADRTAPTSAAAGMPTPRDAMGAMPASSDGAMGTMPAPRDGAMATAAARDDGAMATMPAMSGMGAAGGADLSDVKYPAFLLNGRAPVSPWTLEVLPGDRVRLRLVNGGASTYFRAQLDGHALEVTHADGLAVQPFVVDEILMGMGETYDVVVKIARAGSFTLHAVAQDGSGQAVGVLHTPGVAPSASSELPVPGRRQLSYAQLRAPEPTTLPQGPVKSFRLPLQGDMKRYVWMIDGQAWPKTDPLEISAGDRVQVELVNQTMMWHPMHLHGHFFRVLNGAGDYCPLKHTVNVAPGETLRFEFTADNPGKWFFHCHNAYHLEAGMAREFVYVT